MATTDSPTSALTRVALYARVSTLNGQDPEMQLRELREYASHRGWTIAGEYVDQGVSGSKDSRPALNRVMIDVRQRRVDAVLVLRNWFRAKGEISTGAVEGLNYKIRVVTRRSYGFRTYEAMEIVTRLDDYRNRNQPTNFAEQAYVTKRV